jgi:hypothetical protein
MTQGKTRNEESENVDEKQENQRTLIKNKARGQGDGLAYF